MTQLKSLHGFIGKPQKRFFSKTSTIRPVDDRIWFESFTDRQKFADSVDSAPSLEFEKRFAQLAYKYIQEKAPSLMDDLVGFQLVKKTEDNRRAVGVFGFEVGENWVYVPVFLFKGMLKGYNLMFLSEQSQFVPLTEAWVNYVTSHKPISLGSPSFGSLSQKGVHAPDFTRARDIILNGPMIQSKFSSAKKLDSFLATVGTYDGVYPWAKPFIDKAAGFFKLDEKPSSAFRDSLVKNFKLCKRAYSVYQDYPAVEAMLDNAYGEDLFVDSFRHWAAHPVKTAAEYSLADPHLALNVFTTEFVTPDTSGDYVKKKVRVVIHDKDFSRNFIDDMEGLKKSFKEKGYGVNDYRTDNEVSYIVRNGDLAYKNPDKTGFYNVLTTDGSLKKMFIIVTMDPDNYNPNNCEYSRIPDRKDKSTRLEAQVRAICCNLDNKDDAGDFEVRVVSVDAKEVFGIPLGSSAGCSYEQLPSVDSLKEPVVEDLEPSYEPNDLASESGKRTYYRWYVIVTRTGGTFGPFCVRHNLDGDTWEITSYDSCITKLIRQPYRKDSVIRYAGCNVYISDDVKIVDIGKSDEYCLYSKSQHAYFGNMDMMLQMNGVKVASVFIAGDQVFLDEKKAMSKMATLKTLIEDDGYSFREEDARSILAEAERLGVRRESHNFAYKIARNAITRWDPDPNLDQSFDSPTINESRTYPDPILENVTDQEDWYQQDVIRNPRDEEIRNYQHEQFDQMPDPMAIQLAQQAANNGQTEVMDTAVLASFLQDDLDSDLVEQTVKQGMKSLNHLGKMLLQLYWRYDEMEDAYGKASLPEVENGLSNTFEDFGELILKLKQSENQTASDLLISNIDVNEG